MPLPLEGVRVIDWTIWQQGPVASVMLGDLGADVIKIEERVGGDPGRGMLKLSGVDLKDRPNFYFEANNRNKKSLALDLKQPEGRAIIHQLAAKSDVFVQNFRQGVAARLGLDAATLRKHNPKLIYASASGYGPDGPESGEPSFDYMAQARSGIMLAAGEPDMPPLAIAGGIADQMGAIMLAYGVLAAIIARDRYGIAQDVDASHLGSMTWLQGLSVAARLMMGFAIPRQSRALTVNPLWNHYRCADNQWIALGMIQPDRYWVDLCRALGRPELGSDPRFENMRVRAGNAGECIALLDAIFASQPRAHWLQALSSGGDFIYTVVNSVDDLPNDPQVLINHYVQDFDHPSFGPTQVVGVPVRLSETPGTIRTPAPEFGQHTEEILTDLLGYSWDDIARLKNANVI
ncbi:MAG: CoA transferase [Deltaproteobacteria bacterium]|nr:CoA transferase [Deltaproteobacteria bacterium]MBI3386262.1 CoA transferase [Deltaproteobacteria bacterium]